MTLTTSKVYLNRYVIKIKKSFFISSKKLNLPLIKFINN
jgi:hypothetical protein